MNFKGDFFLEHPVAKVTSSTMLTAVLRNTRYALIVSIFSVDQKVQFYLALALLEDNYFFLLKNIDSR